MLEIDNENKDSLFDLFDIPKGYVFDYLWGCTYSAKESSVNELRKRLKVNYNFESREKWENGESVCIYVQQGNYEGSYFPNFIHPINPKTGNNPKNAHAKVFCIKYVKKDKSGVTPLYRLIIASANLTNSKEMNVYTVVEGQCNSGNINDQNGIMAGLKELIKKYDHELKHLNGLIEDNIVFDDQIEFINVSKETRDQMLSEAQNAEIVIFSPFLDDSVISDFSEQGKLTVVSLSQEIEKICANNSFNKNFNMVDFRVLNMDDSDYSLHAKVYAFKKGNRTVLYMGSANATESAFNGNIEVLTKIDDNDNGIFDSNTLQLFKQYKPSGQYDLLTEDRFRKKCRNIIGSFLANMEYYSVDLNYDEKLNVKLEFKDQEIDPCTKDSKIRWERSDKCMHFVQLTVSDENNRNSKTVTMMVDGMKNEPDRKVLAREVQDDIAKMFGGQNCLYSAACKISNEKDAKNFLDVYEENKDHLPKEDRETAEHVIRDIKKVYKNLVLEPN